MLGVESQGQEEELLRSSTASTIMNASRAAIAFATQESLTASEISAAFVQGHYDSVGSLDHASHGDLALLTVAARRLGTHMAFIASLPVRRRGASPTMERPTVTDGTFESSWLAKVIGEDFDQFFMRSFLPSFPDEDMASVTRGLKERVRWYT